MANQLRGAAALHKKQFNAMVASTGVQVTVRQPLAQTADTSAVTQALGKPRVQTPLGPSNVILAVMNHGYNAGTPFAHQQNSPPSIQAIGQVETIDVVLRCMLEDALVISGHKGGRTIFDTCVDVVYDGISYKVTATDRTGLPPLGPYTLWVSLKKNGVAA